MRRARNESRPRRMVMGVHPVPTLVTLGNLLCGFASIVLALRWHTPPETFLTSGNDCLRWAGLLIFAAMIFDVLDGKVARWTKSTSKFGMEMDSLCDMVSFGVAPAVLVKALIDQELLTKQSYPMLDRYIWPLLAVYVSCAALRLARYNVESESGHRDFFFGMPSPGAAGCAASLAVLVIPGGHHASNMPGQEIVNVLDTWRQTIHRPVLLALPFIMLALGVLMVSRVHYLHIGDRLLRGRKSLMHMLVLGLGLLLIIMHHEVALAIAFNGYMLFGLLNEIRFQLFPSQRPPGWTQCEAVTGTGAGTTALIETAPSNEPPVQ